MSRKTYFAILLFGFAWSVSAADVSPGASPKKAMFTIKNLLTIRVPRDAKRVRVWFAVPQEDTNTVIQSFKVTTDVPVRYDTDSRGNRVGYAETSGSQREPEQISIQEDFNLVRSETHNVVEAAATRPLTEQERAALIRFLQPSTYVVVNDEIKKLAASITDGETNPVLAMHKLYDWTYKNVNYWVKESGPFEGIVSG
jgi:hypothetical protein